MPNLQKTHLVRPIPVSSERQLKTPAARISLIIALVNVLWPFQATRTRPNSTDTPHQQRQEMAYFKPGVIGYQDIYLHYCQTIFVGTFFRISNTASMNNLYFLERLCSKKSKKSRPILYINLLHKMGQAFFDLQIEIHIK